MSLHPIPCTLAAKHLATSPVSEAKKPEFKICAHLMCAVCGGVILLILIHYGCGGTGLDAFGPVLPSALQEVLDFLKRV